MKQFSLDEYLKNPEREVVTRGGDVVKIYHTDRCFDKPIIAEIQGSQQMYHCYKNGKYFWEGDSVRDLFFATERKEGWINLYKDDRGYISTGSVYTSKEKAGTQVGRGDYLTTIKIEWEE